MSAYMGDVVRLYLQELIDWESYFNWRKGEDGDVEAGEVPTIGEEAAAAAAEDAPEE